MNTISSSLSITFDLFLITVELFRSSEFSNRFDLNSLYLKKFVACVYSGPASMIAGIGCEKAVKLQGFEMNQSMFMSLFQDSELQDSKELGTAQVRQYCERPLHMHWAARKTNSSII